MTRIKPCKICNQRNIVFRYVHGVGIYCVPVFFYQCEQYSRGIRGICRTGFAKDEDGAVELWNGGQRVNNVDLNKQVAQSQ